MIMNDINELTLQDILDMLPCRIDCCLLTIQKDENGYIFMYKEPYTRSIMNLIRDKDAINAAYKMLCWCVKNGYVE